MANYSHQVRASNRSIPSENTFSNHLSTTITCKATQHNLPSFRDRQAPGSLLKPLIIMLLMMMGNIYNSGTRGYGITLINRSKKSFIRMNIDDLIKMTVYTIRGLNTTKRVQYRWMYSACTLLCLPTLHSLCISTDNIGGYGRPQNRPIIRI